MREGSQILTFFCDDLQRLEAVSLMKLECAMGT